MYCKCEDKKEVKQSIFKESFLVCSKRLGGCGKEIVAVPPVPKGRTALDFEVACGGRLGIWENGDEK